MAGAEGVRVLDVSLVRTREWPIFSERRWLPDTPAT